MSPQFWKMEILRILFRAEIDRFYLKLPEKDFLRNVGIGWPFPEKVTESDSFVRKVLNFWFFHINGLYTHKIDFRFSRKNLVPVSHRNIKKKSEAVNSNQTECKPIETMHITHYFRCPFSITVSAETIPSGRTTYLCLCTRILNVIGSKATQQACRIG